MNVLPPWCSTSLLLNVPTWFCEPQCCSVSVMAKMFQGFFFDYKTTNGIFFFFWVALKNYQWVVFLQWKQYCYGSQCLTSRTDYFMNTWGKSSQIIIYPLSRVKCKVQDENFNNIHDASQSKSCKLHHNILYF